MILTAMLTITITNPTILPTAILTMIYNNNNGNNNNNTNNTNNNNTNNGNKNNTNTDNTIK